MSGAASMTPRLIFAVVLIWFLLALVAGATGRVAALPFPGPQLVVLVLTVVAALAGTRSAPAREWVDSIPVRGLVGMHAARFVGIAFLVLGRRGELSPVFAWRAGWGDIVTAALAVVLVASGVPRSRLHRSFYLAWNTLGLLDLIVVVATAAWVAGRKLVPGMAPLLHLPLSLLPTFFVPILIASHVFLYRRLVAPRPKAR